MKICKDVEILDELEGQGAVIEKGNYYLLAIRVTLNRGEVVKEPYKCVGYSLDKKVLDELSHSKDNTKVAEDGYFVFCVNINRENFTGGYLYALEGMKVGGYRKVKFGPHLGHRESGIPGVIPPNAKLIVEIRVVR